MFIPQNIGILAGSAYFSEKTKELVRHLTPRSIAIVNHKDIDEIAAISLIQKNVRAVLNYAPSMSGEYPSQGTKTLIREGIPVYDVLHPQALKRVFEQGDQLLLDGKSVWVCKQGRMLFGSTLSGYTEQLINDRERIAQQNLVSSLKAFTDNTLYYASKEMNEILKPLELPKIKCHINQRHVVIVTRGSGYIEDLQAIDQYIEEVQPVLIGVDGGADALIQCGYKPDIILGDMDSVSTEALHSGAEIIVHAYTNGHAPGLEMVKRYRLPYHLFSCFGTSEDAAQLFAYEAGALLIVTLGSHTNMIDFLEKGRKGMGSTLLVRLKIGEKLVDAKGVRLLYPAQRDDTDTGRKRRIKRQDIRQEMNERASKVRNKQDNQKEYIQTGRRYTYYSTSTSQHNHTSL